MIENNLNELLNIIRMDGTDILDYMKEEYNIDGKTVTALTDKDIAAINASYQCINCPVQYVNHSVHYTIHNYIEFVLQEEKDERRKLKVLFKNLKAKPNCSFDIFCLALMQTGQEGIIKNFFMNESKEYEHSSKEIKIKNQIKKYNLTSFFLDDLGLASCRKKLAKHYDSFFTDVLLYTPDNEPTKKALHEIYVPMLWKKVRDPDTVRQDEEIKSPLNLFEKVTTTHCYISNGSNCFH